MPLQNPLQRSIQLTWLALILSILAPAVAQVLGADPTLSWILGGVCALVAAFILVMLYPMSRRYMRELQALTSDQYLVRWQLAQEDWLRFAEDDWNRTRRTARSTGIWTAVIGTLFAMFIAWLAGEVSSEVLAVGGIALVLAVLLWAIMHLTGRATYQKRMGAQGEIYIGAMGVLNGTSYTSFSGFGISLTAVNLEEGDPYTIRFEITANGGGNQTTTEVRVPVPRGREEEAGQVVAHFHGEN